MISSRTLAAAAALTAVLALPAAAPATTVTYDARGSVHKVGGSGSTVVYRGTVRSDRLGDGKVQQRLTIDGLRASGTFRVRYPAGTVRGRVTAQAKLGSGGATFSGSLRITGGTGRYKGASGSGSYSGTSSLDLTRATFHQRGSISY